MSRNQILSVNEDGTITPPEPLGKELAGRRVLLSIQPLPGPTQRPAGMSDEEWAARVWEDFEPITTRPLSDTPKALVTWTG